jgi:hypothetical protein
MNDAVQRSCGNKNRKKEKKRKNPDSIHRLPRCLCLRRS